MSKTSPAQVSFSSGELSPLLRTRFDYQRFQTGLAGCRGFLPLLQGGVTRSPGTIFRGRPRAAAVRLVPFEFAADDALVLEFTPGIMRVWRYGALIASPSNPSIAYELATPFGASSLPKLQWVQSADVIWITDGLRPIQRLARHALDDWEIDDAPFSGGPFRVQNLTKSRKIQASGPTGTVTLTASWSFFTAAHVGSLLQLAPEEIYDIPLWSGNAGVSVGDKMRYSGRIYQVVSGTNTGVNPPTHDEGVYLSNRDPAIRWRFLSDLVGAVRITSVASGTSAQAQVIRALPDPVVNYATYRWSEGAWSTRYGYPATLELHEQRLVAAGTPTDPRTVWFSGVGDFRDFEPGTDADASFAYSIAGGASINRIIWLKSGRDGLHVGALGEEHASITPDRNQPLSATNCAFRFGSSFGSRENARPIAPDGMPMFISKDNARLVEISYSLEQDGNVAGILSRPADHLGALGFAEVTWQGAPQRQAWLRTDSGILVVMVYDRGEEVLGWAPCPVADGKVLSMAVTRDATGSRDVMTIAVQRTINSVTAVSIEEQAETFGLKAGNTPIADAVHLFAASVFKPNPAAATFQVPHLAGAEVHAWTDSGEFGPLVVPANGALTLPIAVRSAVIGLLDRSHTVRTLPLIPPVRDGSALHRRKRLSPPLGIGLLNAAAAKASVIESDFAQAERAWPAQNIIPRSVAADLSLAFTGVTRAPLTSGYADELAVQIEPVGGAPLTITAIVPTISEAGI